MLQGTARRASPPADGLSISILNEAGSVLMTQSSRRMRQLRGLCVDTLVSVSVACDRPRRQGRSRKLHQFAAIEAGPVRERPDAVVIGEALIRNLFHRLALRSMREGSVVNAAP